MLEPPAGRIARTTFFLDTEVLFRAFGLPTELPEQGAKIFFRATDDFSAGGGSMERREDSLMSHKLFVSLPTKNLDRTMAFVIAAVGHPVTRRRWPRRARVAPSAPTGGPRGLRLRQHALEETGGLSLLHQTTPPPCETD